MAKKLSDVEKKASLKALGDYRGEAQRLMKDKIKNLKKVTVASDSKEGLEEGLEKAEDLIKGNPAFSSEDANDNFEDRDPSEYSSEDEEEMEDMDDVEGLTEEELDKKIMKLMACKDKLKGKM